MLKKVPKNRLSTPEPRKVTTASNEGRNPCLYFIIDLNFLTHFIAILYLSQCYFFIHFSGIRNFHPPMFTSTLTRRHEEDLPPPYDEPSPPPYHIAIQVCQTVVVVVDVVDVVVVTERLANSYFHVTSQSMYVRLLSLLLP